MLGQRISDALAAVGVTPERVGRWLGRPCGCRERREKLDALEAWARRVVAGKVSQAKDYLAALLGYNAGR